MKISRHVFKKEKISCKENNIFTDIGLWYMGYGIDIPVYDVDAGEFVRLVLKNPDSKNHF